MFWRNLLPLSSGQKIEVTGFSKTLRSAHLLGRVVTSHWHQLLNFDPTLCPQAIQKLNVCRRNSLIFLVATQEKKHSLDSCSSTKEPSVLLCLCPQRLMHWNDASYWPEATAVVIWRNPVFIGQEPDTDSHLTHRWTSWILFSLDITVSDPAVDLAHLPWWWQERISDMTRIVLFAGRIYCLRLYECIRAFRSQCINLRDFTDIPKSHRWSS